MVVEDEQAVGNVFLDCLTELGHEAVVVRSAEAALRALVSERPDAIILDVNLPGMSGLDFLQLRPIRESRVPIVAVSGVATESQARECLRLGALDFVGKPVAFERLAEVLECLEPQALERREDDKHRQVERRRAPRAAVTFPVRVVEYSGVEWHATAMSLTTHGIKIRPDHAIDPGRVVKLSFTLPDGDPITTMGLLMRRDPDGLAFFFVNLGADDSHRVAALIARLTER